MEQLKSLYQKNREIILYIFFGGLTTLCNVAVFWLFAYPFGFDEISATAIAFIVSVFFAFFTNRRYVFCSKAKGVKAVFTELVKFFSMRIISGGLDLLVMFIFVTWLGYQDMLIKILSNVLVIILNYIFSKLFVFSKKEK